ncbi:hypothetical protein EJA72_21935 [Pseudomonas sp. PB120]|nr:hypothetical protein [Pseudomonas sp. PB120]
MDQHSSLTPYANPVARELVGAPHRPAGSRSGPKKGLLRSPAGASSLATKGAVFVSGIYSGNPALTRY